MWNNKASYFPLRGDEHISPPACGQEDFFTSVEKLIQFSGRSWDTDDD